MTDRKFSDILYNVKNECSMCVKGIRCRVCCYYKLNYNLFEKYGW